MFQVIYVLHREKVQNNGNAHLSLNVAQLFKELSFCSYVINSDRLVVQAVGRRNTRRLRHLLQKEPRWKNLAEQRRNSPSDRANIHVERKAGKHGIDIQYI